MSGTRGTARPGARIAVVGGGIAGLAASIALRAEGFDVTTFERAEALGSVGAALGVHSNAVLALRALRADGPVVDAGEEVLRWEFRSWRGRTLAGWSQAEVSRAAGAPGLTVPRSAIQHALLDRVSGPSLRLGKELAEVVAAPDHVELRFADTERFAADLVVGADGIGSTVRRHLKGEQPLRYAGFVAWRGIAESRPDDLPAGTARQVLGRAATFGTWPLRDGGTYWVATIAGPDRPTGSPEGEHALLRRRFAGARGRLAALVAATPADRVLRTPIFDRPPEPVWHDGRCVLVGDAAHPVLPTTGQGGGQALLDALTLAEVLRGCDLTDPSALTAALTAFEERRRPATTAVAGEAWAIGRMHHITNPFRRIARDRAMRATPEHEWLRRMSSRAAPMTAQGEPR